MRNNDEPWYNFINFVSMSMLKYITMMNPDIISLVRFLTEFLRINSFILFLDIIIYKKW